MENVFKTRLLELGLISQSHWFTRDSHRNGNNRKITVTELWQLYQNDHLTTISEAARVLTVFRCVRFLPPLFKLKLSDLNPQVISEFIRFSKEAAMKKEKSRRFNFDKEIRDLKAMLNWYRDSVDFQYANPVKQNHFKLAIIREIPKKNRQITIRQFQTFLSYLPEFFHDLATVQFFCGARIGEIAGLQWKNIDFRRRVLKIQEVLVWINGTPKVKSCPKNGLSREVYLNDTLIEILRRKSESKCDSEFVFSFDGKPLRYGVICNNFNRAWIKAGLSNFTGTHQLRYTAAQFSRLLTGSIEGAKAITGHQSAALANKYSDYASIDQNRKSVRKLEEALIGKRKGSKDKTLNGATEGGQSQ